MASKWLRGVVFDSGSTLYATIFYRKVYALWLEKVLGFTFISETVAGGRSWRSTEKNGTGGSFSGSNFEFEDTVAGTFAVSDVGKFIVINDDVHYINAGVYRVVQYISTTKIVIDYAAGYDEYPLSSSGLSWWIFGPDYQLPLEPDSIILESPHTDSWRIKLIAATSNNMTYLYVAPGGNWNKQIPSVSTYIGLTGITYGRTIISYWAEGEVNGEWLHMWGLNTTHYTSYLASIEHISPIDTGHSTDELLILKASASPSVSENSGGRRYDSNYGAGYAWSDKTNKAVRGYYLDYSIAGVSTNYLSSNPARSGRENNSRRGNAREILQGSYFVLDEDNTVGNYEILGLAMGHFSVPAILDRPIYPAYSAYNGYGSRHSMLLLTKDSPGDFVYLNEDFAFPWCNLSIRGFGI